jgi:hypothetical protein
MATHIGSVEDMEYDGLAAIACPLLVSGVVTRVALVVVLSCDRNLLDRQVDRVCPVILERYRRRL